MTDRLRGLLPKALDVLTQELEGETPLPAAVHVLKACGLYGAPAPYGPTEAEDVVLAEQERQSDRVRRAQDALLGSLSLPDQLRAMGLPGVAI